MAKGKVYLVGAGPGDNELITLKGLRLIAQADAILYDYLASAELLAGAAGDAEIIYVGKSAGSHTLPQDEINELLIGKARAGNIVVRLKGGDPYLFGRGGEEAQSCAEAGVDFEVVPGVTSALAAPGYAGIPPTHRDCTSNVAIVTGHRKKGDSRPIDIPRAGTVIFLMSVGNIKNIIDSLITAGYPADTKIAAVENGTRYNQRTITGRLDNFIETIEAAALKPPAIFIVGKVVELRDQLDWFGKKPNVLVLGNHPEKYEHLGNIVHKRMIDCVALDDYSAADAVFQNVAKFHWLVFTSVNGAKHFFDRLNGLGKDARSLAGAKIAAIGRTTADRLGQFSISADMVPPDESSAGLVAEFAKLDMKDKNVLLPQAVVSSTELPDGLAEQGAIVEGTAVYKTVDIDPGEIDFDFIDTVLFTSGSTVRAFVNKFGELPPNTKALALGRPTQAEARKFNIEAEIMPQE